MSDHAASLAAALRLYLDTDPARHSMGDIRASNARAALAAYDTERERMWPKPSHLNLPATNTGD